LPLNPYFYPPLHLAPIVLTPLTKSIKSKANSFHPFPKFFIYLFIYLFLKFLDFILCNDEIEMMWKMSKNKRMVDEKGREMQMVGKGQKMKYEITIGLFSRRGRHILGM
jgi:hypothetical protein